MHPSTTDHETNVAAQSPFKVDGLLIQSHASLKSLKRIAREADDRKGSNVGAFLSQPMHALTENRDRLVLAVDVAEANGRAERDRARRQNRGYQVSQRTRKIVEEFFGQSKVIAALRRLKHVGRWKIKQQVQLTAAAYNLVRMTRLMAL